jgi:hypothetical protein
MQTEITIQLKLFKHSEENGYFARLVIPGSSLLQFGLKSDETLTINCEYQKHKKKKS